MNDKYMDDETVKAVLGDIVRTVVSCIKEDWEKLEIEFSYFEESLMYTLTSTSSSGARAPIGLDEASFNFLESRLAELRQVTSEVGNEWLGIVIRVNSDGDFSLEFSYEEEE